MIRKIPNEEWFRVCTCSPDFGYSESWEDAMEGALHHFKLHHERARR
jgi:hypothetical protein